MTSLDDALQQTLDVLDRAGLRRTLRTFDARRGAEVIRDGRALVDFSSNDYLGLASHPALAEAARAGLADETGAGAARLISGDRGAHASLERALAEFKGTDAALLFGSGYLANTGAIPVLAERQDVIYADQLNHASLIDGCRLARAEVRVYPHADAAALEAMLVEDAGRFRRRWIVTDGVFSMDGDLAPLPALVELARRHGAWLYVDDAHGTGVLGPGGRGVAAHFGVEGQVDVLMGTLGKALGAAGAFVAGSATLVEALRQRARTFVFTTATPPALARAAEAGLALARAGEDLRERLRASTIRLRGHLASLGHPAPGAPESPIVPVLLGGAEATMAAGAALLARGFLVGAIRPPTVPMGTSRLRLTLSAAHTPAQVDALGEALRDVLPEPE